MSSTESRSIIWRIELRNPGVVPWPVELRVVYLGVFVNGSSARPSLEEGRGLSCMEHGVEVTVVSFGEVCSAESVGLEHLEVFKMREKLLS